MSVDNGISVPTFASASSSSSDDHVFSKGSATASETSKPLDENIFKISFASQPLNLVRLHK